MSKIFISYSHNDEDFIKENFIPLFESLKKENNIDYFYDRLIRSGGELFSTIDYHLNDCDMAILFLSESFYESDSCQQEKDKLLDKKQIEGIYVLPLVISECKWKEDNSISKNLVLNTDGKNLCSLNKDRLENEIKEIKNRLIAIDNDIKMIQNLKKMPEFNDFLEDADIFKTSHRSKDTLLLSDIYVYPKLQRYRFDEEQNDDIDSQNIFNESISYKYIFIHGDDQSGKTSLLKNYMKMSLENNFIPLYFSHNEDFDGHIFNILAKKFKQEFMTDLSDEAIKRFLENNKENIILLFDDFYKIHNKKKVIEKIDVFSKVICTVDLIYNLDTDIKSIQDKIIEFSIKEFSPKKRNELIKKWLYLDNDIKTSGEAEFIKQLDYKAEQIEIVTGKSLNGGIMPAYPFLILSILSNVETLNRPLNQQITSYGYCYEALIIIAFTKIGMKTDDEIAGCINFLCHFAYDLFKKGIFEMNNSDFDSFLEKYQENIALPFKQDVFIKKLENSRLLIRTTLGTYKFDYKYIYYYFVAKYLTDNNDISLIESLCKNIHKDENAYILIFYSHNNKSNKFYEILLNEANSTFSKNVEITLTKKDTSFFASRCEELIDDNLPNKNHNYKTERDKRLESKVEQEYSETSENPLYDLVDEYSKDLRKSVRLVETMGLIAKNRCTSIAKSKIKELLIAAVNLNLRGLDTFFCLFKDSETQNFFIDFFTVAIKDIISKEQEIDNEKCKNIARNFFWKMNSLYVFVIILKTIQSVGSDRIIPFMKTIVENNPTPVNQLILEGTKIIYGNNLDISNLFRYVNEKNNSELAKSILKILVVEFCKTHPVHYSKIQQLSDKMHIHIEKIKKK